MVAAFVARCRDGEGIRRFAAAGPPDNGSGRESGRIEDFRLVRIAALAIRQFPSSFRLLGLEVYSEVARITGVRGKYVAVPPIGAPWSLIRKWLHSTTTAKPSCSRPGLGKHVANLLVISDLNAPLMLSNSPWRSCRHSRWQALISRSTSNASMPREFAFFMRARNIP